MLKDIDSKILIPFLVSIELSDEERDIVRAVFLEAILNGVMVKILDSLSDENKKEFLSGFQNLSLEQRLEYLAKYIESNESVEKTVEEYFNNEFMKLLDDTLGEYLKSAPEDQKKKFFDSVQQYIKE